jgi:hypothetical protein
LISPRVHARMCSIAWRGRGSKDCTDSNSGRTCSAHSAAHKAKSRWLESDNVPPRRMVMKRGSRILGRITVAPFLLYLPNLLLCHSLQFNYSNQILLLLVTNLEHSPSIRLSRRIIHLEPYPSIRGNKLLVLLEHFRRVSQPSFSRWLFPSKIMTQFHATNL